MTGQANLVMRNAVETDIPILAGIWNDGWQDGHAGLVPEKLARNRTLASFVRRLGKSLPQVRTAELDGNIVGFHLILDDELNQFFLAAEARGGGVADIMMADVEDRFRAMGYTSVWLACAIGNDRAARFYEKQGWVRARVVTSRLTTQEGDVDLDVWRYERAVPAAN